MKFFRLLIIGLLCSCASWAATANMLFVSNSASGVFIFKVNGVDRFLLCDQFQPNATTAPYVANVATLADLTGSTLQLQGDPNALTKYRMVAALVLLAMIDPVNFPPAEVVRVNRRIVDGSGPLDGVAQAIYNFILAEDLSKYDLSGFKIYTNAITQEVVGFDTGLLQLCKVAATGVTLGTVFNFAVAGVPVQVPAGPAPGGTCHTPFLVPIGNKLIKETIPAGKKMLSATTVPAGALVSSNLTTGEAVVTVTDGAQTTLTVTNGDGLILIDPSIVVCKVAGTGVAVGAPFNFTVGATAIVQTAGAAPGGSCSPAVTVPVGNTVVAETLVPGINLSSVTTVPAGALVTSNTAAGTATVAVGVGAQVVVTFVNGTPPPPGTGFVQVCKVASTGVVVGTNFNFHVGPLALTVPAGAAPGGTCGAPVEVPVGPTLVTENLDAGITLTSVSTVPVGALVNSNLAAGTATVTVTNGGTTVVTFVNTFVPPPVVPPDASYHIRYASHLNVADSFVNITNGGAGGAGTASGTSATVTGAFCANVYAFSPDEQLVSCCSCPVTPNGLVSLSARNDLISNTLTPSVPTSIVIKLVASVPIGGTCIGSAATINANNLAPGLMAWGTTIHPKPGAPSFGTIETPFLGATLSPGELNRLSSLCGFIQGNGSGFGICRGCHLGGLGAGRL